MKENAISKINKMGEIGGIITIFAKILIILGLVFCIGTTILCAVIPEEFLTMKVSGEAAIDMNLASVGMPVDESEIGVMTGDMLEEVYAGNIEDVAGLDYTVESMTVTEDSMHIKGVAEDFTLSLHSMWKVMLVATLDLGMTLVTLFFVSALCKAFRNCASPFEESVTKKMQNLAISLIPWAFLSSVTESVAESYIAGKPEMSFSIDLNMVLIILLIFVLVYIFKYGAVLQRESDETL